MRIHSSRKRHDDFRAALRSGRRDFDGDGESGPRRRRPPKSRRYYLREYRRWLWPHWRAIAWVFVLALLANGLGMVFPLLTRRMIDGVLTVEALPRGERLRLLGWLGGLTVALIMGEEGFSAVRQFRMAVLNAKVIFRLRQRLFERLLRLPLHDLSDMKSGGIVSRLSGDVDNVTGLVQMAVITPAVATLRVVLTVSVLLVLNWQLAAAAAALIPPVMLINFFWVRKVRPIYRSMREDRAEVDSRVTESFGGVRVVRAFRRERKEERDYAVGHHTIIRKNLYAQLMQLLVSTGWGLLVPAVSLLIVWLGGYLVIHGRATIGDIFAFQMYGFMLMHPLSQIVNSYSETQRGLAAMERVFEILDLPEEKPDAPDAVAAPAGVDRIEFAGVGFAYPQGPPVIHDFRLTVPGGSVVALVGPSGAGKTTITDLVARFYDPIEGAILLNGVDLRRIRLNEYRDLLGVVQQDVFLFDGTVRDNIAYGRRGATAAEIEDAARRANAAEFIERLPNGYETLIGERGVKLSGGQRQRLSIARAILADPRILVLDEATSNLDTESEQLIQASLAELFRNRTTFVIAHRLSTVTHADIIVVMDQGRIIEVGDHDALMAAGGLYHDMVERQRHVLAGMTDTLEWS